MQNQYILFYLHFDGLSKRQVYKYTNEHGRLFWFSFRDNFETRPEK